MRNIAIFLVIAAWLLLGFKMCTDYNQCCTEDDTSGIAEAASAGAVATETNTVCSEGIICFADNSCEASYGANFEAFKDSIVALVGNNKRLKITGVYNSNESYDGGSASLGSCRAEALKESFSSLSSDQIITNGQLTVGRNEGIGNRFIIEVVEVNDASISSDAVIYFPYNSTRKLNNGNIEAYLNKVAEDVKNSGRTVKLVGHTDSQGREAANQELGQRRANIIADYLIGKGVPFRQINASSKGETQPIDSNDTEVGRAKNRRTELTIIK